MSAEGDRMPGDVRDRVVVVTGGAQGIGRGIVDALEKAGARIAIVDREKVALERLESQLQGGRHVFYVGDTSQEDDVRALFARTVDELGTPWAVINNVGANPAGYRPFDEIDPDVWDATIAVNLRSPFLMSRQAAPLMREAGGGRIVNIASIAAERAIPGIAAYSAAKGAVVTLTKVMAIELAPHDITVNAIAPGHVMTEGARAVVPQEIREGRDAVIPLGRHGAPSDIAAGVVFALSASPWLTGTVIPIDGGMLAAMPVPATET
jgi:NAD(P)-dependent dehydrogenase (short-subunit alcohol dehydrogenase family)